MTRNTIEGIKEKLKTINNNIEILSTEYINSKAYLDCKCKLDGNIWRASWSSLIGGKGCPECKKRKLADSKRLTIDMVKNKLLKINPSIEILSDTYINSRERLKCKCLIDGNIWYPTWQSLSQGVGCEKCFRKSKRFTLKGIKTKLKIINPNIKIISTKYIDSDKKLKCKCLLDGYEWESKWSNLSQGTGCPECSGNIIYTLDKVKEKLSKINPNIEIASNHYKNNSTKLKCVCKIDGYEWDVAWGSLSQGRGCPECSGRRRDYTIHDIREKLFRINPHIEILSDKYVNSLTKLKCKCLKDDYEWEAKWSNLSMGYGCPECGGSRRDYTIEIISEKLKYINPNIKILSKEYKNAKSKIKCKCLIDNNIWYGCWGNLSQGLGCPECGKTISKGEKLICNKLDEIGTNYTKEHSFEDLLGDYNRVLRFDFAIFNHDTLTHLIEYDGQFHFNKCHKEHDVNRQQRYDSLKNEYCIKNNIPLIRIPYWEKDNISEILTDIFICKNSNNKFIINNNQIIGQSSLRPSLESAMKEAKQNVCTLCVHDCNLKDEDFKTCPNFEKGMTCEQYWSLLKDNNVNIKRMCNTYNIKRNYLYQMLNGKMRMKYKYAMVILGCINKRNYIPEQSMAEAESKLGSDSY